MDGIGITANTTQDIWKDHPEKFWVRLMNLQKNIRTRTRAVMMAVLEASKWIDAGLQNKLKMAEVVAQKSYINTGVNAIDARTNFRALPKWSW
jgi:nitrate/nitrite transport system substrate-binding protein